MSSKNPPLDPSAAANRLLNPVSTAPNPPTLTPKSSLSSTTPAPPGWSSQSAAFASQNGPPAGFPQLSASTAEILKRLQANAGQSSTATSTAAFEAKKAEVMKSYVTSDNLPTPPPIPGTGRRGRGGGRVGTPSGLKTEIGGVMPVAGSTPTSGRGSGRGRGRGRGGGRGGKRKRAESYDSDDDDSDISTSYTPLPTKTKSGRNVNKPTAFVPTLPEPSPGVKRRKSTKTILTAQCKICHRGTDPGNNRIVFCDVCNTAYHQYCHDPPIDNEVVNVLEKEWLCGPCERAKQSVIEGMEGLAAGDGLSIEEKRAYLSTLPSTRLVSLLLHSTIRHPELPIFPPNVRDLIPVAPTGITTQTSLPNPPLQLPTPHNANAVSQSVTSPPNGIGSTGGTPRSHHIATDSSDMDPAEAQLLGEIRSSTPQSSTTTTTTTTAAAINPTQMDEYDDGYDTDPPAHYPKPGHGLARTLRPESEDLQWLVDDNFEVFSHGWKGDGTGVGADAPQAGLNGAA
ncbi:uncharacterized protein BDR25DRAFT_282551 [Lindgomyces ingoldianus]|uniref:Uncharacterized protein n=1 Tax=Lindgomyces ingoldianus TaxID=673940 RepID=A0ACB6R244_9PLEO|nr:uncharacterized protein BDR25DRAFT_282551 [Lindgomyces ingoldianus]KAF2473216.1 hypothetical protein BDR25DRAFT_282551 [Lindgomyces ingoldianus]